MSPSFSFQNISRKSIWLYVLSIFAVWLLANLAWLQEILSDFFDPQVLTLIISFIWIVLKKFIEDTSK